MGTFTSTQKKVSFLFFLILITIFSRAQVSVTATAGTVGPTPYTTLGAAFAAINSGTHQGAITISLSASTTEASAPCVLNSSGAGSASYTSVLIRPTNDGVIVSGATASGRGLIELNGADNVTIDGDNPNTTGTNRNLTLSNTATSTTTYTSVVRLIGSTTLAQITTCDFNTVKNCIINGSTTSGNSNSITGTGTASNTTFGIIAGPTTATNNTNAPSAIGSVTTSVGSGGTFQNLVVDNNQINQVARGVALLGGASTVFAGSNGPSITNNVIGSSTAISGLPPFTTPATSVYVRGVFVSGAAAITITGNTFQNIVSYVGIIIAAVELNSSMGAGVMNISSNAINGVSYNGTGSFATKGILVASATGTYTIASNNISNIYSLGTSTSSATDAIEVNTSATSGTIGQNKINNIQNRSTGTYGVYGINLIGGSAVTVSNNFISGLVFDITGGAAFSTAFGSFGIRVGAGINHKILHNTVSLSGALPGTPASSILTAALCVVSTSSTGLDIRNNIFSNTITGGTTSIAHVSIYLPTSGTSAMNLTLNNNAYYCNSTSGSAGICHVGTSYTNPNVGATTYAGLYTAGNFSSAAITPTGNLRAYTSVLKSGGTNDNASLAFTSAAPFVSSTDLHINTGVTPTTLESGGASVGITSDIDGQVRPGPAGSVNGGATAADIGADEFDGVPLDLTAPSITYTPIPGLSCTTGNQTFSAIVTDNVGIPVSGGTVPRVYWKVNAGAYTSAAGTFASGTATNSTWNFTITGPFNPADVISYFVIAQDNSANVSANPGTGLAATNVNTVTTPPTTPNTFNITAVTLSGTYTVGVGQNYTTLTAAVNAYNTSCSNGPVVFELTDALYSASETFPITINSSLSSNSVNTLTIKPASGVNATISGAAANSALIKNLNSYTIFDGSNNGSSSRNLTITNTSTTGPTVLCLGSTGTTAITGVTVKNTILINGVNTSSALVVSDGATIGNAGYFTNITIQNNNIQKAYVGVYANAVVGTGNGSGLLVTANDLNTSGANAIRLCGIYLQGVDGGTVAGNNIANFESATAELDYGIWLATATVNTTVSGNNISALSYSGTSSYNPVGVYITPALAASNINVTGNTITGITSGGSSTTLAVAGIFVGSAASGGITIQNNKIDNITNTNTGGYGAAGIWVASTLTSANINVRNNFVSNVTGKGYTAAGVADNGYGILLSAGGGYNIDFNTVNMAANQTSATSIPSAINITSGITTAGSVNIRNNIFSIPATVGANRYAIYSGAASTVFGTINYNDYYSSGSNLGYIGSNRANLAAIQTGFGGNANSLNVMPVFTSTSDLHLSGGNLSLDAVGLTVAGITTDIDGDVRCPGGGCPGATSVPDIGADEFLVAANDAGVTSMVGSFCPGNQTVQVVVKNFGVLTLNSVDVTWSMNGIGQGTVSFPAINLAPGTSTNVTLGSYTFIAGTNYNLVATTSNPNGSADQVTSNDAFTSATFQTALSGTYTVGSGGNFTTLTAAVAAANAYGLCGPTVFSLTDATYSGSETFPLTINSLAGSSSVNTLTIKPATGVNAAITGSVATGPMIKILNSNTIVEGSNNGSLSRNLTITNTGATSPNILLVGSTGTTAITNVTLKNFIAKNGSQDYTGIFISDAATVGNAGYFNNITVQNLDIRNSYVGVFANATVAAGNGNNTKVLNCLLNNTGANAIGGTGIALSGVDGGLVSGNDIGNFESDYGEVDNGILLGAGTTNTVIEKNIIHDLLYTGTEGYGAKGITVATGLAAANVEIRNNMIRNITGDGDSYSTLGAAYNPTGIYLSGASQAGVNIYYNTIYLYGNTLDYSSNSASVGIGLDDGAKATIKNNIIRNELGLITYGVGAYAIAAEISSAQITGIDYNDYYVASNIPSGNYIGRIGSNSYATLAAFQTASGGDANSKNIMPNFVSSTNLHMVAGLNISLNNLGTTIGGITTDIDGDVRGASPDMGADEFTPVALDAAATVLVSPSGSGICGIVGQNIVVQISNFGTSTLTSIPVTVSVSGPVSQVFNATYTGSLASGASTNFTVGSINMNVDGGTYIFNGQTSLPGDQNTANDAFVTVNILTINPAVNLTVAPSPVCLGQPAILNATATSGSSFSFANSGSSGPVNLTVTDNSTVGASSTINLTGTTGTVSAATTVKVTLNINHLWVEDLDVFLVDPTGTRAIELTTDNGADGEDYVNTVLQTGAANNINTVTASDAPFTATYAPEGTVSTGPVLSGAAPDEAGSYAGIIPANPLVGAPLTGNWTLRVFDDYGLIPGTLVSWSLEISGNVTGNFTHAFTGPGSISTVTYSGIDNATGEVTLTNTPAGSQPFNVVTTGPSGCSSSKNLNVQVNTCTNTWQGDVAGDATNWFNSGNWSLNYVPNVCGADVVIPTSPVGGVFPVINTTSPAVGNVTVQSNANITINAGKNISVCGNWIGGSGNASQILGAGVVVLNGSSSQQLSGKTQFQNLQLNNATGANMQAGSRFEIFGEVALQNGTLSTGSGQLVFRSTSDSQIGIIDNFSPGYTGTISGTITAERYYHSSATYDAHFMGSPVDAPALSEFATGGTTGYAIPTANCDETQLLTGSPYGAVASMDESVGAGCAMKTWKFENTATPAQNAKGYSVRKTGAGVITVNGNPNLDASYAVNSLNNTGWPINTSLQGRPMGPGWHMISNPYLANLDISSTPAGFDVVKLVWINDGGGSSGSYQPATVVAPFQAFMVHRIAPGSATYTVNATQRTKNAANYSFQKQGNDHELTLTAINNGTQRTDVTKVAFNSAATVDHDPDFDCIKIAGALDRHTLYTYNSNPLHWTAINTLNSIEETSTVNVGFEPGINGSYTLQFDGLNTFDPTSYITLEDKKLNVFHDVRSGNYSFTANANDDWNRFVLHFTPAAKFNTTDATCAAAGQVNIEQPGTANWNYFVTNGSNVTISSGVLNNSSPVKVSVPNGVYTVTLTDNNNYTVVKNVLVNGVSAVTAAMNVSKTTAEEGEEIDFVNTSSNATSVLWEFGDGVNSATTNASHTYSQPGVYNVKLTVSSIGGCVSSTQQTVTVTSKTSTGINDLTNGKITIWSHANMVYVDFSKAGMVQSTIDIYNILGQVVSSEKFGKASIYSRQLNNLDAGYVIVSVKSAEGTTTKKVFISNSK